MASTSMSKQSSASNYVEYPAPLARYEDVAANPKLFMETLEKLHASMRTKFMIPIIGGRELDLHRLFVEVTARGGYDKIIIERRWKEVTAVFNFPSSATNASFVLRKYYGSLLHHYEQLYFFKARGSTPGSSVPPQTTSVSRVPSQVPVQSSPEYQAATPQQKNTAITETLSASSESYQVVGVIDGKFESGYLVTVTVGSEKLKGVLYQAPKTESCQVPQLMNPVSASITNPVTGTQRRRRRKKSEIKRRDPAHPKPNRSGYNFFFAEQHARLKPLYPGKDREISRMIGELWNSLNETQKSVYQEKAVKDKERYQAEMEEYRARLKGQKTVSSVIPIQQWAPEGQQDSDMKTDEIGGENGSSSSGKSDCEEDESKPDEKSVGRVGPFGLQLNVHPDEMDIDESGKVEACKENCGDAIPTPKNSC